MRTVLFASLRVHTRRHLASAVAVMLAAAFIVVTNALTSSVTHGISAGVARTYRHTDLVVATDGKLSAADRVMAYAAAHGGSATPYADAWLPVTTSTGGPYANGAGGSEVGVIAGSRAAVWQTLTAGRPPHAADEVVADASAAKSANVSIGDTLLVGAKPALRVRVVGLAAGGSYESSALYLPWQTARHLDGLDVEAVGYRSPAGTDPDVAASALRGDGLRVSTRQAYVDHVVKQNVTQGADVLRYLLLLFAVVSAFVAVLVIANTFTIVFAQRTQDFALLRCIGATRRQVRRSVRLEALTLGALASTAGVLLGLAAGGAATAALRGAFGADRFGRPTFGVPWLVGAFALGLVVTLAAAWWPTRRVTAVSPLAAMRPESPAGRLRASRVRTAAAILLLVGGTALMALAIAGSSIVAMLAGGVVSFVGVLMFGPVLVPAVLRLIGLVSGRTGPSARLATRNALRNPKRTAATAASLLVGVTLTTAFLVGTASVRAAGDAVQSADFPVDVSVTGTKPIAASALATIDRTAGVARAAAVPGVVATVDGQQVTVLAPSASARKLARLRDAVTARGDVALSPGGLLASGRHTITVAGRSVAVQGRPSAANWGGALLVTPATLARLTDRPQPLAVWVRATASADASELAPAVSRAVNDASTTTADALAARHQLNQVLDVLQWSALGLLAVAVLIALVGIASTVGLSVLERQRENALLRALGLTRRQLRRALGAEGVLLAVVAAVIGIVAGTGYAWVAVRTLVAPVTSHATLQLPVAALAGTVAVAVVAGLTATLVPARRAARLSPAEGLTRE